MRHGLPVILSLATLIVAVACDAQDPYGDRKNQVQRNANVDGGDDGAHAKELFLALEPDLQNACGKQCHADGTQPGNPPRFLAGPDVYATIKSFPNLITRSVFESRLLAKGAHEGPALDGPNEPLREKIVEWLDAEASLLVAEATISTPVIDLANGPVTVDLGALEPKVAGAKLLMDASLGPAFLSFTNMRVRGGDTTAVRVVHPIFRLVRGGGELADPADSFSNIDEKFPQADEKRIGPGQLFLTDWKDGDKLRITFETIEPTTIPVVVDTSDKPCKALQAFIDNAKQQFQDNGCLDCHGDGGNGQSTMDLSQLDQDDATACAQARKKIDFTNKANSPILQAPAGNLGHTGGKVGDPQGFTDALNIWINGE